MTENTDSKTPETPETPEERAKRRQWLSWVTWFTRIELAVASLVALAICVGRVFVAPEHHELYWVIWKILVAPAFLAGLALTFFVSRASKRHPEAVMGELAFWGVFPGCAFVLLLMLTRMAESA